MKSMVPMIMFRFVTNSNQIISILKKYRIDLKGNLKASIYFSAKSMPQIKGKQLIFGEPINPIPVRLLSYELLYGGHIPPPQ